MSDSIREPTPAEPSEEKAHCSPGCQCDGAKLRAAEAALESMTKERDEARRKLALLVKAAAWAEDEEAGPIRDFERELIGDPILMALLGLSDMRRMVWEPVSDFLHVSNFEEVMPALRASALPQATPETEEPPCQ